MRKGPGAPRAGAGRQGLTRRGVAWRATAGALRWGSLSWGSSFRGGCGGAARLLEKAGHFARGRCGAVGALPEPWVLSRPEAMAAAAWQVLGRAVEGFWLEGAHPGPASRQVVPRGVLFQLPLRLPFARSFARLRFFSSSSLLG